MLRIRTESGTTYEFNGDRVRRVNVSGDEHDLRRDGEWVEYELIHPIHVGVPMVLRLNLRGDGVQTIRTTSAVSAVEAGA